MDGYCLVRPHDSLLKVGLGKRFLPAIRTAYVYEVLEYLGRGYDDIALALLLLVELMMLERGHSGLLSFGYTIPGA